MSHIISFSRSEETPTAEAAEELRQLLEACTLGIAHHLAQPDLTRSALRLKRERVTLPRFRGRWFSTGRDAERLSELINVLATVARTADALDYLAATVGGTVEKCNPSTSDDGHDIEVIARARHVVVEVSDVAGDGNANRKMTKDLTTLIAASPEAELLLAVSENSGRWLTSASASTLAQLGASCRVLAKVPADQELATWLVAVNRQFPGSASP